MRYADAVESMTLPAPLIGLLPDGGGDGLHCSEGRKLVGQLRSMLDLHGLGPGSNVITVAGVDTGDGATELAAALAAAQARVGRQVLLIDAQLSTSRSAGVTDLFGAAGRHGLRDALRDPGGVPSLYATPLTGLQVLAAGTGTLAGLSPDALARVLFALRRQFDVIVIDAGGLLAGLDASVTAAISDRVLAVADREQRRDRLAAAMTRLSQIGAACCGLVLNRALPADLQRHHVTLPAAPMPTTAVTQGGVEPMPAENERKRAA